MGKKDKQKRQGPDLTISQPLNFRHEEHISPSNVGQQHYPGGAQGTGHADHQPQTNVYVDTSPKTKLPPPCPGPSIVQNIGTLGLDQQTLDKITHRVTDAVKREFQRELQPLRDKIEQLLTQTSNAQTHCLSCQSTLERQNSNQPFNLEENSSGYANFPEIESAEVEPIPGSSAKNLGLSNVPNPIYNRQPETIPLVCRPKPCNKPPIPLPRPPSSCEDIFRHTPGRHRGTAHVNKRDCYALALKTHIEDIVDSTLFAESELPDVLISGGCLTEDECRSIREKVDRKDQIRILVTVIKTRDLEVLTKFLEFLEKDNKQLVQKIKQSIETNISNGYREKKCSLCKLKSQVNVKYVADKLWAEDCILDDLYNELIYNEKPTGTQDKLWERIINSFAAMHHSRHAFEKLEVFLRAKGHYVHLADEIQKLLSNTGERLNCFCKVHVRISTILSSSTSASVAAPSTDFSSTEILSGEFSHRSSDGDKKDSLKRMNQYATINEHTGDEVLYSFVFLKVIAEKDANENVTEQGVLKFTAGEVDHPPPLPVKKKQHALETAISSAEDSESTYV